MESVNALVKTVQYRITSCKGRDLADCFLLPTLVNHGNNKIFYRLDPSLELLYGMIASQQATGSDYIPLLSNDVISGNNNAPSPISNLRKPYDSMIFIYLRIRRTIALQDSPQYSLVFRAFLTILNTFLRHLSNVVESNWEVSVLKVLSWSLYRLACIADVQMQSLHLSLEFSEDSQTSGNISLEHLEECARALSRCFTQTLTDRSPMNVSKKWGSLYIIILLFKSYFRLNNVRLCNNVLRALENPQIEFPPLEQFPKSEWIAFVYYRARIHINYGELKQADSLLRRAFMHCNHQSKSNLRLIVTYLVTVNMLLGRLPTKTFLERYNLVAPFMELVKSIKRGNVSGYQNAIQLNREFFIKRELYLILMTKLKHLTYRTLLRRVIYFIQPQTSIHLSLIIEIFDRMTSRDSIDVIKLDLDEVECILANLICDKYLNARLSHEDQALYFGVNSFPKLEY